MGSSSRETFNDNYLYFFKKFAYKKSDYVYKYYLNLVESIIKPQKLCLTCTELQSSCTICLIYRGLLTPEKYYEFISPLTGKNVSWKIRHNQEHFEAENLILKNIEPRQNLLVFIKKVEALDEIQTPQNINNQNKL